MYDSESLSSDTLQKFFNRLANSVEDRFVCYLGRDGYYARFAHNAMPFFV